MSVLRFFEEEMLAHIDEQLCPAGQCKQLVRAKCVNTCPAGVDTPAYLALIAQGRYAEGLAIHRERNPFPIICGRACPAFCETKCRRAELDDPIAIRMTKRFMAEHESREPWTPEPLGNAEQRCVAAEKKVAVIGSGPAGLTAAVRLAQFGYGVTVFEKLPVPGGMMSCAIPEYRLPRQPLFLEIENIQRAGVEIRCQQTLGKDFTLDELLDRRGFAAVVLAIGAHRSRPLGMPGDDKAGVINGLDFLREVALESCFRSGTGVPLAGFKAPCKTESPGRETRATTAIPDLRGKRVGVVGGGDVAIDAARVALAARRPGSACHVSPHRRRHAGHASAGGNRRRAARRRPVPHAGQSRRSARRRQRHRRAPGAPAARRSSTTARAASRWPWRRRASRCRWIT